MKKLIVLLSIFLVLVCGISFSLGTATAWAAAVSADGHEFEGDWVVSNYEEGGVLTLKYDETVVRISKNGGIFLLDGPTTDETGTRFRVVGSKLVGVFMPDVSALKERFPTASERVLQQAVASRKVFYNISLTMGEDGRILVERDNLKMLWMRYPSYSDFHHVERYPGFFKYTLTRKK